MKVKNKSLHKYLNAVKGLLPCSFKQKKSVLRTIKASMQAYLSEHPQASTDELVNQFGSPEQIAAAHIDVMDTAELLKQLRMKKRISRILTTIVAVVLLIWTIAVTVAFIDELNSDPGHVIKQVYPTGQFVYNADGSYILIEILDDSNAEEYESKNITVKTAEKTYTYYDSQNRMQWKAVLSGTFTYDGSVSTCASIRTRIEIYNDNWHEVYNHSFITGITGIANLAVSKNYMGFTLYTDYVQLFLTCDAKGNLS